MSKPLLGCIEGCHDKGCALDKSGAPCDGFSSDEYFPSGGSLTGLHTLCHNCLFD